MAQYQRAHGNIGITGPAGRYFDSAENFAADHGRAAPDMPDGVVDQIYEPGRRHAYGDGQGNVIGGGPRVWQFGDGIIAVLGAILAAQKTRRAAEEKARQDAADEEFKKRQALAAEANKKANTEMLRQMALEFLKNNPPEDAPNGSP